MLKISLLITFILVAINYLSQHIILNTTISEPIGYYFAYKINDYMTGDKVIMCVIDKKHISAMHKLGLSNHFNDCKGQMPFLMKTIVAKVGDTIEVSESGILVNGQLQNLTRSFKDFNGINLYPLNRQKFVLNQNEFFVLGNTQNSYDSRYLGVIQKDQIYSKVILFWRMGHG